MRVGILMFLCACVVSDVRSQDCKVGGKRCADHGQCCGGCCFYGECIDTYRSCLSPLDVCRGHACAGDESCVVYVPPACPGCEPAPLCRDLTEETYFNGE